MADVRSVVVLTTGTFESSESPDELEQRFSRGRATQFTTIEDAHGLKHWVNLAQLVEIREPGDTSAYVH